MLEQLPKILEESRKQVERALNSPLKLRAQLSEIVYPNAKYGALFSSVMSGDSALGIHSSDSKDLGATADSCSASKSLESPLAIPQNKRQRCKAKPKQVSLEILESLKQIIAAKVTILPTQMRGGGGRIS